MVRTILYAIGGILLGLAIHLVVILTLPRLADNSVYSQIVRSMPSTRPNFWPVPKPGEANPLRLDPNVSYAVCLLDLTDGPGDSPGVLPVAFWSIAVYDRTGTVLYSTTNRDGIGRRSSLGIFDPAQTRLLAEQKIDIATGALDRRIAQRRRLRPHPPRPAASRHSRAL